MIILSLKKFRSSDATETFRVKNSDNVLTKSRKLETKSSWIIKLRSFFKFVKVKEPRLADFNFSLLFIYRSRCTCVLKLLHVFTACQSYETHDRSGAPNGRGPRFLEPAAPAIATPLQWAVEGVAVGYIMHHRSNANGINGRNVSSQIFPLYILLYSVFEGFLGRRP